ncbi:MAG TPA: hypothetical protein VGE50_10785, partial [Gammaproteobacteria bacterium]
MKNGFDKKMKPTGILLAIAIFVYTLNSYRTPPMSEINSVKYSSNVEGKYPLSVIIDATRTASVRLESS